jgi:RNA polymerase sigma-70 factor (ECF subfamily)
MQHPQTPHHHPSDNDRQPLRLLRWEAENPDAGENIIPNNDNAGDDSSPENTSSASSSDAYGASLETSHNAANLQGEAVLREAFEDVTLSEVSRQESAERAMELLFKQYYPVLCSYAARVLHSRTLAEDVVSEVMTVFWQERVFERVNGSYRTYLFSAVRNRSLNLLRNEVRHKNMIRLDALTDVNDTAATAHHIMEYEETRLGIERAVSSLGVQCRRVFVLSRFEGKKNKEIADELGISLKAVEANITRGLAALKKALQERSVTWLLVVIGSLF